MADRRRWREDQRDLRACGRLCFNGTRDTLCRRDLMEHVVDPLRPRWEMHWLEGADHAFHVLKSSGRTDADVLQGVAEVSAQWLSELAPPTGGKASP